MLPTCSLLSETDLGFHSTFPEPSHYRHPAILCESGSCSVVSNSATPWTIQPMEFSRPEYWSGYPFPSPGDLLNPRIEPRSLILQADSLSAEPQGKAEDTVMGSLSLLQWIFLTQESNRGLLHCRWILFFFFGIKCAVCTFNRTEYTFAVACLCVSCSDMFNSLQPHRL